MPADQKDRYIHYLVDKVNELDLDKRAMELAVEEFQGIHDKVLEQLAELQKSIAEVKAENAEKSVMYAIPPCRAFYNCHEKHKNSYGKKHDRPELIFLIAKCS